MYGGSESTDIANLTELHTGSDSLDLSRHMLSQASETETYRITGANIIHHIGRARDDRGYHPSQFSHTWPNVAVWNVLLHLTIFVPKSSVNDDGSFGARNDAICASIEHKLDVMASLTCMRLRVWREPRCKAFSSKNHIIVARQPWCDCKHHVGGLGLVSERLRCGRVENAWHDMLSPMPGPPPTKAKLHRQQ